MAIEDTKDKIILLFDKVSSLLGKTQASVITMIHVGTQHNVVPDRMQIEIGDVRAK